MGSYRELSMLKETNKLNDEAIKRLSGDSQELEAKVIKAKSVRHGVDPEWVRGRMDNTFKEDAVVVEYRQRIAKLLEAVYKHVDLTGV